jgi:hypothetical protein
MNRKHAVFVGALVEVVVLLGCSSSTTTLSSAAVDASRDNNSVSVSEASDGPAVDPSCHTTDQDIAAHDPAAFRDASPEGACAYGSSCSFDLVDSCGSATNYVSCACANLEWMCDIESEVSSSGPQAQCADSGVD